MERTGVAGEWLVRVNATSQLTLRIKIQDLFSSIAVYLFLRQILEVRFYCEKISSMYFRQIKTTLSILFFFFSRKKKK